MNTTLWILQAIMSAVFLYSGVCKSIFPIRKLVYEKGQTGVEKLPLPFVRFIGISEIFGAIGLVLPWLLNALNFLTGLSAILMAIIMIPAGIIHYQRKEPKNILTNVILFCMGIFVAYGRLLL